MVNVISNQCTLLFINIDNIFCKIKQGHVICNIWNLGIGVQPVFNPYFGYDSYEWKMMPPRDGHSPGWVGFVSVPVSSGI